MMLQCHSDHNSQHSNHPPRQNLRQRDEPSWLQSLEREALQNGAGPGGVQGQRTKNQVTTSEQLTNLSSLLINDRKLYLDLSLALIQHAFRLLTHIACPGQALGVVAHQRHETGDKQVPLSMGTGTTRGVVDVIPLHQNLHRNTIHINPNGPLAHRIPFI